MPIVDIRDYVGDLVNKTLRVVTILVRLFSFLLLSTLSNKFSIPLTTRLQLQQSQGYTNYLGMYITLNWVELAQN